MDKFSKINSKTEQKPNNNVITDHNLNIVKHKDSYFIEDQDIIAILPYFVDDGHIFLKVENNPTYQYGYRNDNKYKNAETFLTVITSTIKENESVGNAVRRELFDSAGIVLNQFFPLEISTAKYSHKKNSSKVYLCLLEIRYTDYKQTTAKNNNDGSKIIKLDLGYLDDIITHDILTELMLNKLKMILPKK